MTILRSKVVGGALKKPYGKAIKKPNIE